MSLIVCPIKALFLMIRIISEDNLLLTRTENSDFSIFSLFRMSRFQYLLMILKETIVLPTTFGDPTLFSTRAGMQLARGNERKAMSMACFERQ
ncbi:hypothetical protein TNCV_2523071 [Trichonephila clavipes]|nr:hypothetical protein TNCV_2523071 [Trichonephila clavipes]